MIDAIQEWIQKNNKLITVKMISPKTLQTPLIFQIIVKTLHDLFSNLILR